LPVTSGQQVKKGEVLARLDPRDFQNTLNAKKAVAEERRVNLGRTQQAFEKDAATIMEVDQAAASFKVVQAEVAIAEKALEDTVIRAPFGGVVAYVIARQHQKVAAREAIMSLQNASTLEIVIHLPEQVMALTTPGTTGIAIHASFDYLPDRALPMTVKEYATEADPATQTYAVTLQMPAPEDVRILPGMSATVTVGTPLISTAGTEGYLLPLAAVPADGQGQFYVWLVEPAQGGLYTVRRHNVTVGPMVREYVLVTEGVSPKERIVTAGVHLLEDGQQVRLLGSQANEVGT
jgi:RND family efflux transporter MFP subunit